MADCYIIGRAIGERFDEEKPEREPCGIPDGTLVYESDEQTDKDDEPVFIQD